MSDEPTPELRALAAHLFAAGRAERPGPALGRRLLLIEPPPSSRESRAPASAAAPRAAASRSRGRGVRALWMGVAAAATFAAGSVGLWSLGQEPVIDISPDPVSARVRPVPVTPPRPSHPPSPPELAAVPRDVPEPIARDAEHEQRPTEAAARAPVRIAAPTRLPAKRAASDLADTKRSRATAGAEERGVTSPQAAGGATTAPASAPRAPASVAPAPASVAPAPASVAPAPAVVAPAPAVVPLGLSEELALLKEARLALRAGEAKRALDVLDRHARARAADGLHAEATLLRIEALDALGQRVEATDLAARFVRENPFNALADRAKTFIRASAAAP